MKVQLLRPVEYEGVQLTGIISDADVPMGTLQSIVGSDWGVEVAVKAKQNTAATKRVVQEPEDEIDEDEDVDSIEGDFDTPLTPELGISKTAVTVFKKAGITTLAQASDYIAANGSLEPIKGISQAVADRIAELLK